MSDHIDVSILFWMKKYKVRIKKEKNTSNLDTKI